LTEEEPGIRERYLVPWVGDALGRSKTGLEIRRGHSGIAKPLEGGMSIMNMKPCGDI